MQPILMESLGGKDLWLYHDKWWIYLSLSARKSVRIIFLPTDWEKKYLIINQISSVYTAQG